MKKRALLTEQDYSALINDLKLQPFRAIKIAFALMAIIPLLIFFYLAIGPENKYDILLGNNGLILTLAVLSAGAGFLYAYKLIHSIIIKLLYYSYKCKHADEEKSNFVSNVSHEIKTPLMLIGQSMKLLLDGTLGQINDKQKKFIDIGDKSVKRLSRLVTNLLDLTRIEAGKVNLQLEKANIQDIVNEIINLYHFKLEEKKITLEQQIKTNLPDTYLDIDRIRQVIINLLQNAIKYSPSENKIIINVDVNHKNIIFKITDSGHGIPLAEQDKIFNKFERVTKERTEGTGLGLTIAKDIVNLHKGKIWIDSKPEQGSTFCFTIPTNLH